MPRKARDTRTAAAWRGSQTARLLLFGGRKGARGLATIIARAFHFCPGAVELPRVPYFRSRHLELERYFAALHRSSDGRVAERASIGAGQLIAILFQDEGWRAVASTGLNRGVPRSADVCREDAHSEKGHSKKGHSSQGSQSRFHAGTIHLSSGVGKTCALSARRRTERAFLGLPRTPATSAITRRSVVRRVRSQVVCLRTDPVKQSRGPGMPQKTVINVQGFRFSALVEGAVDGELVLFLHGFPEFADAWRDVMRRVAEDGFYAVAVDQRGYSPERRPKEVSDYAVAHLVGDIRGFADAFGRRRFHLAGHDWGAFLAWVLAAQHPDRVQSLTALSTPHPAAFSGALETDQDQRRRSQYVSFFRAAGGVAESFFEADNYQSLRSVYQGKLSESAINENIARLREPGALTAALNWYRALDLQAQVGKIVVPTLYIWSTEDLALGETAAMNTARYVTGPYRFEKLEGRSHWLLAEVPDQVSALMLDHLRAHRMV
jgi:pimeloyl-ACP methyl ester carboxylesterase